jgi:hypothetical protein
VATWHRCRLGEPWEQAAVCRTPNTQGEPATSGSPRHPCQDPFVRSSTRCPTRLGFEKHCEAQSCGPIQQPQTTAAITHLLIWNFWSLKNCMSLGTSERAAAQLCKAWPATSTGSIWGVNVEVAGKNSLEDDAGICVKTSALSLRVQNTQLNVNPRNSLISPARS